MKLYATTTSERASKGQGGNNYINVLITDENKKTLYNFSIIPDSQGHIFIWHHSKIAMMQKKHGGGYYIKYDEVISEYNKLKGKQKKGECKHTGQYIYNTVYGQKCKLCDN